MDRDQLKRWLAGVQSGSRRPRFPADMSAFRYAACSGLAAQRKHGDNGLLKSSENFVVLAH